MNINVAVSVVFDRCGETDWGKQNGQTRAGGLVLGEARPIDESRNDDDASPDAEQTGGYSTDSADEDER